MKILLLSMLMFCSFGLKASFLENDEILDDQDSSSGVHKFDLRIYHDYENHDVYYQVATFQDIYSLKDSYDDTELIEEIPSFNLESIQLMTFYIPDEIWSSKNPNDIEILDEFIKNEIYFFLEDIILTYEEEFALNKSIKKRTLALNKLNHKSKTALYQGPIGKFKKAKDLAKRAGEFIRGLGKKSKPKKTPPDIGTPPIMKKVLPNGGAVISGGPVNKKFKGKNIEFEWFLEKSGTSHKKTILVTSKVIKGADGKNHKLSIVTSKNQRQDAKDILESVLDALDDIKN